MSNILIVEDQNGPLGALEFAINEVMPLYDAGFSNKKYDIARCYDDARNKILENNYALILLDNRMSYHDLGELEHTDFDRFCDSLQNIGYTLIPLIKERNQQTVIIGTSSLSAGELEDLPTPDYTMSKMYGQAEDDLARILGEIERKKNK
ncbi:MAG: hypothetical protein A3D39_00120 [Candidatus Buchananbacteria bacterium RIFCSPHIGHO2_02_FULL_39_17]|uniref:Response regulatory domain-containing protein n=1 Tax=Candidatus Buchananbacteria bacterium RIFCSPLOWO2_01_FULL_40_23b TaxID=1797544 RepID=A0A1G1YW42_9BACT|nr:MAG: hypothetical protein A3D39_00120 [Candidatus Buchananbacteria bacterium RIFCSPHIGHO2_02_FULL_39_17]OGY55790.1 MAG: hypothetical protein A2912_01030 [Candidatus Buchananbacteria bacterium RIFCSPLOWO2_01_FULL_40_23b]